MNAAIQEYHYLPHRGVPLGPWSNAITHLDAWLIGDEDGHPYLEEQLDSTSKQWTLPIFLTGDPEWNDYECRGEGEAAESAWIRQAWLFGIAPTEKIYYFSLSGGNKATLSLPSADGAGALRPARLEETRQERRGVPL